MSSQVDRILRNNSGEEPPPARGTISFLDLGDEDNVLLRVKEVMLIVAKAQDSVWYDDARWRALLPDWFLQAFPEDVDTLLGDQDLWEFGSWLDAMKCPGWEWWSSRLASGSAVIRLTLQSDPYSLGPLVFLLTAAGGSAVNYIEDSVLSEAKVDQ